MFGVSNMVNAIFWVGRILVMEQTGNPHCIAQPIDMPNQRIPLLLHRGGGTVKKYVPPGT